MDVELFQRSVRFRQNLKRNVVYVPPPDLVYDALLNKGESIEIPKKATIQARTLMAGRKEKDDFIYTAAIEYPFKTEPYMSSRYSDGTYPVWYGSKEIETSIFETVYHAKKFISSITDYDGEESIEQQRSIYNALCDTILLDIVLNKKCAKLLVSDDYTFTQKLGREIKKHKYSGLLSPSARHFGGTNANIFNKDVLSKPKFCKHLNYLYLPDRDSMEVYENNEIIFTI